MVRRTVKKVMWVGRATVFLVGLAVVFALIFGVAAAALGAPMNTFKLGQINTSNAISTLVGAVPGSNLKIENTGTNANATALELKVPQGNAPLTINAGAGKATNLNADRLDDREASSFADGVGGKATNAELLDGQDSSAFLGANQKVSDSDRLDGKDSAEFYASGSKVADSNQLDGVDSTGFIQGKGNMYRAKRTLGFVIDGRELILNVPGFGRLEGSCTFSETSGVNELALFWFNGEDTQQLWWLNKDGVGYRQSFYQEADQLTPRALQAQVVILQVGMQGRTATITAAGIGGLLSDGCPTSAQAVAQID